MYCKHMGGEGEILDYLMKQVTYLLGNLLKSGNKDGNKHLDLL